MRAVPTADVVRKPARRNAAIVVADPQIAIVESGARVDPSALDDAFGLLVTWAIRACSQTSMERPTEQHPTEAILGHPAAPVEATTPQPVAAYGPEV